MGCDLRSILQIDSAKYNACVWICRKQSDFHVDSMKQSAACNQCRARERLLLRTVSFFRNSWADFPRKTIKKPAVEIREDSTAGDSFSSNYVVESVSADVPRV
jgi:hypothetical protein